MLSHYFPSETYSDSYGERNDFFCLFHFLNYLNVALKYYFLTFKMLFHPIYYYNESLIISMCFFLPMLDHELFKGLKDV